MQGHQDYPLSLPLRRLQVLEALDVRQPRQSRRRPPPAHCHLEEGDAVGGEILAQQAGTLGRRQLGEAQLEIARGDPSTRFRHQQHQRPQDTPQFQQQRIGQLHHQPQHPQAQPQQPVARMKKSGTKAGTVHQHIQSGERADHSTSSRRSESAAAATCGHEVMSL
ncbi:hypothetical protein D3C75_915760 [compost metagenome]